MKGGGIGKTKTMSALLFLKEGLIKRYQEKNVKNPAEMAGFQPLLRMVKGSGLGGIYFKLFINNKNNNYIN